MVLTGLSIASSVTLVWTGIKERILEPREDLKNKNQPELFKMWSLNERKILTLEYNQLHNEILTRDQYGWLIISIFAAGSFLVSFGVEGQAETLPVRYLISLFLVIFCAISQRYYDGINKTCWDRRREIENLLGFEGPKVRYEKLKKSLWYQIGASTIWFLLWLFLAITYIEFIIISLR